MQTRQSANYYTLVLDSPLGRLGINCEGQLLTGLHYVASDVPLEAARTPFERKTSSQLIHFFNDPTYPFTLPLDMRGTDFQCRVWEALRHIPAGQTLTYGELAQQLGSGARAVGNACRNNPVSVIVPCHRVVAASGLGGYSGKTDGREINRKQWLLRHEGNSLPALKTG